jgi:hypothetical protein
VQFLLVLAVLAVVVWVVSAPLRATGREGPDLEGSGHGLTPEGLTSRESLPALEAEKEAKYREIRDAELDRRTGKLSDEDWEALDAQLRAEAVEILKALDAASDEPGGT